MQKLQKVLKMVRFNSLIATILPFVLGISFTLYYFNAINVLNTIVFLLICCLMQMIVNLRDSIKDYDNAKDFAVEQNQDEVFAKIGHENDLKLFKALCYAMILSGAALALYLVYLTNLTILLLGLFSTLIGYLYTGGKYPIENGPLGELFSGLTMGYIITLACVLVNIPTTDYSWNLAWKLIFVSGIAICAIANIMLANNTCDYEADLKVNRHTFVSYVGKKGALKFYTAYYVLGYLLLLIAIILRYLPIEMLVVFLTIPIIIKNTKRFFAVQVKKETFILTIKNDVVLLISSLVGLLIYLIFK
ncbi:prenyltransferase [Fructilactobacillus frigidiflavus]|uniref:prenyltransferase n=1 Tax=Fructilactobacillus frigidiflavus TaxID=3242688 RepID=UPI00375826A9